MRKIKYQGGLTKRLTVHIALKNRKRFEKNISKELLLLKRLFPEKKVEIDVVSFSSRKDFNEQVLSILSFLRYIGTPLLWTIYSDGSHQKREIDLLKSCFEFVEVKKEDEERLDSKNNCKRALLPYLEYLLDYSSKQPLGKKLFFYLNHQIVRPTVFLDSDVLFYDKAAIFESLCKEKKVNGWFLPDDDWGCLDSRYLANSARQLYQVNSGLFLLNTDLLRLEEGLDFLKSLNFNYEYFSEQTTFHILFKSNNLMPLDPRIFILNSDDQFDFSYLYSREKIAMRHYTSTVRHKMWQKDWKWQLSLSKLKK